MLTQQYQYKYSNIIMKIIIYLNQIEFKFVQVLQITGPLKGTPWPLFWVSSPSTTCIAFVLGYSQLIHTTLLFSHCIYTSIITSLFNKYFLILTWSTCGFPPYCHTKRAWLVTVKVCRKLHA